MFKVIEIIDRYKIKISIGLILLYIIGVVSIIKIPEVGIQHIIFISVPTVLFSLIHYVTGIAIGLISVLIVLITHFEQQKVTLTLNTYVLYGVGILMNTGMSYLVGGLKDAYLRNKKAFQEVEQSKAKYQKVVDNIREGMVIVDSKGSVIFMNRSASVMLNLPIDNIGFRFLDAFKTSIPFDENCGVDENGLGSVTEYLLEYDHPEQGIRQIAIAETPYLNREGNISGSLKFIQDITVVREKEISIELLKKRNEYLFAELNDRISNKLNAINSYINLYLRNDKICKSEGLDKLDDIIHTMAFMNSEFFKNFQQQTVNLETCIARIIHDLSEKYYYSSIHIQLDLTRKDVHIDIAVPFGMLFTIIVANIFLKHRNEIIKPMVSIDMGIEREKCEIQIAVDTRDFFSDLKDGESRDIEKEIISALLLQFHGSLETVSGAGTAIKLMF
jgi:two-component sensor histidine kinase/PAS domain-containing protein